MHPTPQLQQGCLRVMEVAKQTHTHTCTQPALEGSLNEEVCEPSDESEDEQNCVELADCQGQSSAQRSWAPTLILQLQPQLTASQSEVPQKFPEEIFFTPVPTDQRLNPKAFVRISVSRKSPDLWFYPLKMHSPGADPGTDPRVFAALWICILQHLKSFTNHIPPSKRIRLSKLSCEVAFQKQKSIWKGREMANTPKNILSF